MPWVRMYRAYQMARLWQNRAMYVYFDVTQTCQTTRVDQDCWDRRKESVWCVCEVGAEAIQRGVLLVLLPCMSCYTGSCT